MTVILHEAAARPGRRGDRPTVAQLRSRLEAVLSASVVEAIEALVAEMVRVELAESVSEEGARSPWFSIAEAAEYLRTSERTIERAIARERLRSTTFGRRRLMHRDNLDALVGAATGEGVAPTTPPRRRAE